MTEFRTTEQIQTEFRRMDPQFNQVRDLSHLHGLLTDDDLGEATLYASGWGPVMYDLGVLNGPEWEGVNRFLNSHLVSVQARRDFQQFTGDVQAADENHDGILNNQEIVRYAQGHTDRWPNVALFRSATDVFLNRLPGYLAQPNLDRDQVARLWGVMNYIALEMERQDVLPDNRRTVYGLSLEGFPSEEHNDPSLIRAASAGTLTPQELSTVHHVLETSRGEDGVYDFQNTAPISPQEADRLYEVLQRASDEGHSLHGMTLVFGNRETDLFRERDEAALRCLNGALALRDADDVAGLTTVFERCATDMESLEGQNPDHIGVGTLMSRAYAGHLSPTETALLRTWMQEETCNGTLDCLGYAAIQQVEGIADDPSHFILHNGVFWGGSKLYDRLVLRNAFETRLSQACGGQVINPRDAYRQYQSHLTEQMRATPRLVRFLNYWTRGSHTGGWLRRLFVNFPVTFTHLAAFNAGSHQLDRLWSTVADPREHPDLNSGLTYANDVIGILAFSAFDTYDAFNRTAIQNFARENPGLCRQQEQTVEQPAEAPAPAVETETAVEHETTKSLTSEPAFWGGLALTCGIAAAVLWADDVTVVGVADDPIAAVATVAAVAFLGIAVLSGEDTSGITVPEA